MYSMPPYAFMAKDYTTMAALYTHHQYIAGFMMVGSLCPWSYLPDPGLRSCGQ
jgi:hypothetical protein